MININKNKLKLMMGTSKPAAVFTLLNLVLYGAWLLIYIICTFIRASLFSQAQAQMSLQGQFDYTITVSSPVFTFLKIMLYILPVLALVWGIIINRADKKAILCDKRLIIAALAVVVCAAFTALIDIGKLGLVF